MNEARGYYNRRFLDAIDRCVIYKTFGPLPIKHIQWWKLLIIKAFGKKRVMSDEKTGWVHEYYVFRGEVYHTGERLVLTGPMSWRRYGRKP